MPQEIFPEASKVIPLGGHRYTDSWYPACCFTFSRILLAAIFEFRKEIQHLGIGSMLYPEIALRARQRDYTHTELSWVVEDNIPMNKVCQDVGGTVTKNYRLYEKIITV